MRLFLLQWIVFFFQAEDGIRYGTVTGVQTCALPISGRAGGDTRAEVVIGLRELRGMPGAAAAEDAWITHTAAAAAARMPVLAGPAAHAAACSATLVPLVTGHVDQR